MPEHDDGTFGPLLHGSVDQEESPVGVAAAGDDEEIRRRLLQRVPAVLEPIHHADEVDVRPGRQGRLDELAVYTFVERDQSSNLTHGVPPSDFITVTGLTPRRSVSSVTNEDAAGLAPLCGRSENQIFPLSEAKASCAACSSLRRRTTLASCEPPPRPPPASAGTAST